MKRILVFVLALINLEISLADSEKLEVDLSGSLSLSRDILLSCQSVTNEIVTWMSPSTNVVSQGNSYECKFARTTRKAGVTNCSQTAKTELAKNETRKFRIAQVKENYVQIDFSTADNALILICKTSTSSNMTELNSADLKKIVISTGVDILKIERSNQIKTERIRYYPPAHRKKTDLITI